MRLVPAAILVGTFALFVLVELALQAFDPGPVAWPNDVAAAASGAGLSNLVNNLPAWLALSPVTSPAQQPALLVGVNAGGMLLLWGSLANLLWRAPLPPRRSPRRLGRSSPARDSSSSRSPSCSAPWSR